MANHSQILSAKENLKLNHSGRSQAIICDKLLN